MARSLYSCSCPLCGGQALPDGELDAGSGTLPPAPLQTVYTYPYTGDYRIDALLLGAGAETGPQALDYRWNAGSPLGTPVTVSYSFMTAKPVYGGTDDGMGNFGFSEFTDSEKVAVRQIMAQLQMELGIRLVEVDDSAFSYGQIRFGNNFQQFSAGYTWLPVSTNDDKGGDVWLSQTTAGGAIPVTPGSFAWATLVHEIGHALGLKHAGNYNAGTVPTSELGNFLGAAEDNTDYTIMSYRARDPLAGQERDWYGMYDLLALKALYGSGTPNPGDDTYRMDNRDGRVLGIIDDEGGFDTLDLSAVTRAAIVDLRPGGFSSVGFDRNGNPANNNLSLSLSTLIESFVGTAAGDRVMGNDGANRLFLGGGNNAADGAGGIDVAVYGGPRSSYQLTLGGASASVTGPGLSDLLADVERLAFSDRSVAIDLDGAAGITAKVLGAVFGAPAIMESPQYVGIGLQLLDAGLSYEALMQLALNVRAGITASHAAIVDLLYFNVVGADPTPEQAALYTGWLDSGSVTVAQLGVFAADTALNLAHIDWAGLNAHGIDYI